MVVIEALENIIFYIGNIFDLEIKCAFLRTALGLICSFAKSSKWVFEQTE